MPSNVVCPAGEQAYQHTLSQLYTLAYYALGNSAAAYDALALLLARFESKPAAIDAEELFRQGIRIILQHGCACESSHKACECPDGHTAVLSALSGMAIKKRLALLLRARHGMSLSSLVQ